LRRRCVVKCPLRWGNTARENVRTSVSQRADAVGRDRSRPGGAVSLGGAPRARADVAVGVDCPRGCGAVRLCRRRRLLAQQARPVAGRGGAPGGGDVAPTGGERRHPGPRGSCPTGGERRRRASASACRRPAQSAEAARGRGPGPGIAADAFGARAQHAAEIRRRVAADRRAAACCRACAGGTGSGRPAAASRTVEAGSPARGSPAASGSHAQPDHGYRQVLTPRCFARCGVSRRANPV